MKFFMNKRFLFKLIACICIFLTLINFGMTPISNAESLISKAGGVLVDPVVDLMLLIGDGIIDIVQNSIMGTNATELFELTNGDWWKAVLVGIIIVAAIVAAVIIGGAAVLTTLAIKALTAAAIGAAAIVITDGEIISAAAVVTATYFGETFTYPSYSISPEEIFSGKILLFDPNIFNPKEVKTETDDEGNITGYYYEEDGEKIYTSESNSAATLKDTIAKWYYAIRTIAIIGLSIILLYVGIRIVLASVASEKAKYKQMLIDWLIAMCLIFLMQYIMVFANLLVESITKMISSSSDNQYYQAIIDETEDFPELEEKIKEINEEFVDSDEHYISIPTNLMGMFRVQAQQKDGTTHYIGYAICYVVLVLYTVMFSFIYLRRLLYLLFLTVISPLVAMTYPLDKITDGKAQAFNMWLREYIFNLIIQPFHLILYTIFVSMAFELAGESVIYSLVVIGFMIPAEKFLRTMFGFNKASTPGFLGGMTGAALTMSAMKSLAGFASGGKGKLPKDGTGNKVNSGNNDNIDFMNRSADSGNSMSQLLDASAQEGKNNNKNGAQTQGTQTTNNNDNKDPVMEKYSSEGFNKNAFGEYFNPWTDDYDPDYDPHNDDKYNELLGNQENAENKDEYRDDNNIQEQQKIEQNSEQPVDNSQTKLGKMNGYVKARMYNFKRDKLNKKAIAGATLKGITGVAKTATKYGLATTAAGIGLAAGVASGDPKNVLAYTSAGAYSGASIGEGTTNRIESSFKKTYQKEKQRHEDALKTQYGANYSKMKKEEQDKEFQEDAKMRKYYQEKLSLNNKEEIDNVMKQAVEFRKWGVTDNDTIASAIKLNKDYRKTKDVSKENIAAARIAKASSSQEDFDKFMTGYKSRNGVTDDMIKSMRNKVTKINGNLI